MHRILCHSLCHSCFSAARFEMFSFVGAFFARFISQRNPNLKYHDTPGRLCLGWRLDSKGVSIWTLIFARIVKHLVFGGHGEAQLTKLFVLVLVLTENELWKRRWGVSCWLFKPFQFNCKNPTKSTEAIILFVLFTRSPISTLPFALNLIRFVPIYQFSNALQTFHAYFCFQWAQQAIRVDGSCMCAGSAHTGALTHCKRKSKYHLPFDKDQK